MTAHRHHPLSSSHHSLSTEEEPLARSLAQIRLLETRVRFGPPGRHSRESARKRSPVCKAVMKFPLPANLFPPLTLSPEDERKLADVAEAYVKKTVEEYYELLTELHGVVDEKRWKKIKQRGDVRVYKERSAANVVDGETASNSSSASSNDSSDSAEFKGVVSALLTFGTIQGNLDDVMYGALNSTTADMQLKSAYCEDGYVDWAVLVHIVKPSAANPFRELSVKWVVKALVSKLVGAVMRVRDAIYIESIGFAETPNGERIGYAMRHSVDIPGVGELPAEFKIVRAKVSFTHLFRQRKENCVEVFIRGFISPLGDANASLAALTAAETSVADWQNVHCAEMKKLARMLRSSQQRQANSDSTSGANSTLSSSSSSGVDAAMLVSGSGSTSELVSSSSSPLKPGVCSLCTKSVGGGLFSGSKTKKCRICSASVCPHCRVKKILFLPTLQEKVLDPASLTFCTRCVIRASNTNSTHFATLDAREAEGEIVDYLDALEK